MLLWKILFINKPNLKYRSKYKSLNIETISKNNGNLNVTDTIFNARFIGNLYFHMTSILMSLQLIGIDLYLYKFITYHYRLIVICMCWDTRSGASKYKRNIKGTDQLYERFQKDIVAVDIIASRVIFSVSRV